MDARLSEAIHWTARSIEVAGIAIVVIGAILSSLAFLRSLAARRSKEKAVRCYRSDLGRAILLGLEFLVAADIINTVAIEPTPDNLAVLAGIVLIRTFLSFSLEVEIEGHWPWQRAAQERRPS